MNLLEEKTKDAATEKHVPYVEKQKDGYLVKVGQNQDHPMTDEHSIEWIELHTDNKIYREYLKPGNNPQAFFCTGEKEKVLFAREYCNIHGLWKN
jgi:superoxide reductase